MSKIWILAANSSNATLFTADSPMAPLVELATFDNPDARAKQMHLISDRPGRSFDSHGEGRHAMESQGRSQGTGTDSVRQVDHRTA